MKKTLGLALAAMIATTPASAATLIVETIIRPLSGAALDTASDTSTLTEPGFRPQIGLSRAAGGVTTDVSVDLVTGSLRGSINALNSSNSGAFNAGISEQFRFNVANAAPGAITRIGLRTYFDATLTGGWYDTSVSLETRIYTSHQEQTGSFVTITNDSRDYFRANGPGFSAPKLPINIIGPNTISGTYEFIHYFDIRGPITDVFMNTGVQARSSNFSKVEFGNSAHLGFVLPQGVIVTSQSGNAFTVSAFPVASGAVPEPATWAMMIGGFGMIGWRLRLRPNSKSVQAKRAQA